MLIAFIGKLPFELTKVINVIICHALSYLINKISSYLMFEHKWNTNIILLNTVFTNDKFNTDS